MTFQIEMTPRYDGRRRSEVVAPPTPPPPSDGRGVARRGKRRGRRPTVARPSAVSPRVHLNREQYVLVSKFLYVLI